ncbi:hypothetical protein HZS_142, partial [Henneguya salminicola]
MLTSSYFVQVQGGKKSLKYDNIVLPEIKDNEILISNLSALIMYNDVFLYQIYQRNDKTDGIYSLSNVVSGVVQRVGLLVKNIEIKDRVIGLVSYPQSTGLSQYCTLNEPLANIVVFVLKKLGQKIMLYTQHKEERIGLEYNYPDLVVIDDSATDFLSAVLSETFGIGV